MIIKKHKNRNEYVWSGEYWVRNFTKPLVEPVDLNNFYNETDQRLISLNESRNIQKNYVNIDSENIKFNKAVIVSDGFEYEKYFDFLNSCPKDVAIFSTNKFLFKNNLTRRINLHLINNPYNDIMSYGIKGLKNYPPLIFSIRSNHEFAASYPGQKFFYVPTSSRNLICRKKKNKYTLDDYRNPICALICLSYHLGVQKLLLLGCDNSSSKYYDGMIKLKNEFYCYPQSLIADNLIDANCFWFNKERQVKYFSYGNKLKNAEYIEESQFKEFIEFNK